MGLGSAGPDGLSLAAVRNARDALRVKVKRRSDPSEERVQEAKVVQMTFRDVAKSYIIANEDDWRNTLTTYVYPEIGDMPRWRD